MLRPTGALKLAETASAYRLSTGAATLTVTKKSPRMTLARTDGTMLFAEASPLSWTTDGGTTQTLTPRKNEQFYGAGEQNGGYNHTGKTVEVANSFNWNEGGCNNSQPYYVSPRATASSATPSPRAATTSAPPPLAPSPPPSRSSVSTPTTSSATSSR